MTTYRVGRVVTPDDVLENAWIQVDGEDIRSFGRRSEGMPADGKRPEDLEQRAEASRALLATLCLPSHPVRGCPGEEGCGRET